MPSLRAVTGCLVALAATSGTLSTAAAQGSSELAGGWIVTSWTSADGETIANPQRGLFIFTATGHYSMMYVPGTEARPRYAGENQTDAEKLAAYDSFIANSGRYRVNGNRLTYEAFMAKDPNYMAEFGPDAANGIEVEFSITGGILTLKWMTGISAGVTATFRRPQGS